MKKYINKLKLNIFAKEFNDVDKLLCYIVTNFKEKGEEIINQFIDDNVIDLKRYGAKVFKVCCTNSYIGLIRFILNNKVFSFQTEYDYAIGEAAYYGNLEVVKLLLADKRVNPAAAIKVASRKGNVEIVKLLLEDGRADTSVCYNYAIGIASQEGHVEVVKLLLEDGRVDPSACDNCAIREALAYGRADVVKLLLSDERVSDRCSFMKKIDKLISE